MLVLSRKMGEEIRIGGDVILKVISISGDKVRIAIEAPRHVSINRGEIHAMIHAACPPVPDTQ
jgi:carbon storage regulator